ncbi:MAG: hypothetical protein NC541_13765 [bacterium]|nr:hypothetical protein [bacterium]
MKRKTKIGYSLLTVLAVASVLTAGIDSTDAYFTTYAEAAGGYRISLGDHTDLEETISKGGVKHVQITNTEGAPVYVRVKAFSGSAYPLTYVSGTDESGAPCWTEGTDGYWYYKDILREKEESEELRIEIAFPQEPEEGDEFNVIVIYESTPVRYHYEGDAYVPYADWDEKLDAVIVNGKVTEPAKTPETGGED